MSNKLARLMAYGTSPNSLADASRSRDELARTMTHRPQADIEQLRGQDPLTDWALGMRDRALHPLQTAADYSQQFQDMSPVDMGMQMVGGGMAGSLRKIASKAVQKTEFELARGLHDVELPEIRDAYSKKLMAGDRPTNRFGEKIPPTEWEIRQAVANHNSSLSIDQGGLGLHPDNTAMDRAKATGVDTPAYHGTMEDFNKFDIKKSADIKAAHVGTEEQAGTFAEKEGGRVLPLMVRPGKTLELERDIFLNPEMSYLETAKNLKYQLDSLYNDPRKLLELQSRGKKADIAQLLDENEVSPQVRNFYTALKKNAQEDQYESLMYPNKFEGSGDSYALFNPSQIRSKFAAFDPFQRNSANILAGGAAGAVGLEMLSGDSYEDMASKAEARINQLRTKQQQTM